MIIRTGIGQDSHRFLENETSKPCILGGIIFENTPGLKANSDGDVVIHTICNSISSVTGTIILGGIADELCLNQGITDSQIYLEKALETLGNQKISHLAISIEGKRPKIKNNIPNLRQNLAKIMNIDPSQIGITATTGEGLTDFGRGLGIQCICIITTVELPH